MADLSKTKKSKTPQELSVVSQAVHRSGGEQVDEGQLAKHKRKHAQHGEDVRKEKKKRKKDPKLNGTADVLKAGQKILDDRNSERKHSATVASTPTDPIATSTTSSAKNFSDYLATNNITIHAPHGSVTPILNFEELPISPQLKAALSEYKEPTPIQACSWPAALAGMDIIGIAETGSGKTLAFGLPAVAHIVSQHPKSKKHDKKARGSQITVLVISPTRELALQTHETLTQIGALVGIQSVCVFGGVGKDEQRRVLAQPSTKVLVGTPGRLLDLASEGACDLGCVTYLVLDEADRMLDKGFENDIRRIIEQTADMSQRQTLMFSATWPKSVQNLAATFLKSPVRITIGSEELAANSRVKQAVEVLDDPKLKSQRLRKLLKDLNHPLQSTSEKESRILVFVLYKKEADRVLETVQHWGYSAGGIHGDINQNQRMKALEDFKTGRTGLLVATDVAARGLDIPNVSSVINYSFPLTVEDYVHRIGRTGRGGKHGESYTFFTGDNHERALAGEFAAVLRNAGADPSELQARFPMAIKKREHSAYGAFYRDDIKMPNKPTKLKF